MKILSTIQKTNVLIYKSGRGSKLTISRKHEAKRQPFLEPDNIASLGYDVIVYSSMIRSVCKAELEFARKLEFA